MARHLVTGGAGFIGSHVASALAKRGDDVLIVDDLSTGSRSNLPSLPKVRFIQGDVRDRPLMNDIMTGVDRVFHLAAMTSVPDSVNDPLAYHDVDATGTLTVLEAARAAGAGRFILSSSSAVYGDQDGRPAREEDGAFPLSPYAAAKYGAESYCYAYGQSLGLETVVLRYFNVFGPRQRPDLPWAAAVPQFIRRALDGGTCTIFGSGEQTRDFVYVEDVARANVLAADAAAPFSPVYNIGSGRSVSVLDLVRSVYEALDLPPLQHFAQPRPGDILHSAADVSRAERELGFRPALTVEQGIEKTLRWFQNNPLSPPGA